MPLVDEILTQTKLTLKDFDFYACCTGPGSFTGVRIGVSTVKAFVMLQMCLLWELVL